MNFIMTAYFIHIAKPVLVNSSLRRVTLQILVPVKAREFYYSKFQAIYLAEGDIPQIKTSAAFCQTCLGLSATVLGKVVLATAILCRLFTEALLTLSYMISLFFCSLFSFVFCFVLSLVLLL